MKKKWSKSMGLFMLAMVLIVTACGSNSINEGKTTNTPKTTDNSSVSNSTDNDAKPVELTIMWWGPDTRHEATLKALEIYTKQHANVTFKPEYLAWDAFWAKLPTLAASKSITDVLQMDAAYIQEYVGKGTLEDLSDIDLSGIVDSNVIENLKIDGKLYGIPLSQNAQGVAFNKTALEAAGVDLPQKDWTWEQYFEFGRKAKEKLPEGQYGISDTSDLWDWYLWYQTANGGEPLMSDGGKTFTLDKDLFFEYHNTFAQLRQDKIVPAAEQQVALLENDPTSDPMGSGVVMTRGATTGSVNALESMLPGQVDVVNLPVGEAGGGWAQSTIFLSVSANSKNKEQAKEFLKWFITDAEAGSALALTRGIPINPEIYKALEPNLTPQEKLGKKIYDVALDKALPFFPIAEGYSEWVDTYKATMQSVMFGKSSIEDAYEKLNTLGLEIAAKR
ncbi:MAG TPA: sugar ABC transporter substrate-binding protein [Candidatus Paenibacillus intestinavium]|nr:sugar ABC transporter substrate-binding protein [Candidatus Paenibacillus intestinavium]